MPARSRCPCARSGRCPAPGASRTNAEAARPGRGPAVREKAAPGTGRPGGRFGTWRNRSAMRPRLARERNRREASPPDSHQGRPPVARGPSVRSEAPGTRTAGLAAPGEAAPLVGAPPCPPGQAPNRRSDHSQGQRAAPGSGLARKRSPRRCAPAPAARPARQWPSSDRRSTRIALPRRPRWPPAPSLGEKATPASATPAPDGRSRVHGSPRLRFPWKAAAPVPVASRRHATRRALVGSSSAARPRTAATAAAATASGGAPKPGRRSAEHGARSAGLGRNGGARRFRRYAPRTVCRSPPAEPRSTSPSCNLAAPLAATARAWRTGPRRSAGAPERADGFQQGGVLSPPIEGFRPPAGRRPPSRFDRLGATAIAGCFATLAARLLGAGRTDTR